MRRAWCVESQNTAAATLCSRAGPGDGGSDGGLVGARVGGTVADVGLRVGGMLGVNDDEYVGGNVGDEFDVLSCGQSGNQVVELEDEAQHAVPQPRAGGAGDLPQPVDLPRLERDHRRGEAVEDPIRLGPRAGNQFHENAEAKAAPMQHGLRYAIRHHDALVWCIQISY